MFDRLTFLESENESLKAEVENLKKKTEDLVNDNAQMLVAINRQAESLFQLQVCSTTNHIVI